MTCDRCYRPLDDGEHGPFVCPNRAAIARDRAERRAIQAQLAPWVNADDIPGGVLIHNALCHEDGTPRRYYSKSEIHRACLAKGIIPYHDVYPEEGNQVLKDARVHDDWLRSSEAQRLSRDRDEERGRDRKQREARR